MVLFDGFPLLVLFAIATEATQLGDCGDVDLDIRRQDLRPMVYLVFATIILFAVKVH